MIDLSKFTIQELIDIEEQIKHDRDTEWTRALGVTGKVMTPAEGAEWLEADRVRRARNVAAARPRRGPMHY